jgi:hypothetical protein
MENGHRCLLVSDGGLQEIIKHIYYGLQDIIKHVYGCSIICIVILLGNMFYIY